MRRVQRTTRRGKQIISSLKDYPTYIAFLISLIIFLLIFVLSLFVKFNFGKQFKEDNVGRQVCIEWEEVNLREGYSTLEKVITTLHEGSSVTLTGNYYDCLIGNGLSTDSWTEVKLKDGTTGWVVNASIKWI